MENKKQTEQATAPVRCGCGFFGNPLTMNLCSKCYKDAQLRGQQQKEKAENKPLFVVDNSKKEEEELKPVEPEENVQQTQVDPSKCWQCKRKVGLLGFKCKCNYVFCSQHRYSDTHSCPFDYKTQARNLLEKQNPVVGPTKLNKF